MPKETPLRVLGVAALVCVACSIVVSAATVGLRPLQQANKLRDKQGYILQAAGLYGVGSKGDLTMLFQQIEERVVDLDRDSSSKAFHLTTCRRREPKIGSPPFRQKATSPVSARNRPSVASTWYARPIGWNV